MPSVVTSFETKLFLLDQNINMVMTNAYQSSFIVQNFINIVCLTIIVSQVFIKSRFIRVSLVFSVKRERER